MAWHPNLTALRNVLADLYPSEADARRVVADAGLDPRLVAFDPKAINTWQHILEQALKANLLDALVAVAREEYSKNSDLAQAIHAYESAHQANNSAENLQPFKTATPITEIETIGGTSLTSHVTVTQSDMIGRDKIIHGDEVHGDKIINAYYAADSGSNLLQSAKRRFEEHTKQILPQHPSTIRGIAVPLAEIELTEEYLRTQQPLMILGDAGVGKSEIAYKLVKMAHDRGKAVLLLDARRLAGLSDLQALRGRLDLTESINDAIARLGQYGGCRVVIDQLDSVFETSTAVLLKDLAINCSHWPGVEIVIIARNTDRKVSYLEQLQARGFQQVSVRPLDEATTRHLLDTIGINDASPFLIDLGANLLYLDILSRIQAENPHTKWEEIANEVALWKAYFDVLCEREELYNNLQHGEQAIEEATALAWKGLRSPTRTVELLRSKSHVQQRLIAWNIVEPEHGLFYRFRHEQIHDYLAARDAFEKNLSATQLLNQCDRHKTTNIVGWMDQLYKNNKNSPAAYRKHFIEDYLGSTHDLPFYAQFALFERYLHRDISGEDPQVVSSILNIVKKTPDIRRHFFQSVPHVSWVARLCDHGFLDSPPPARIDEQGRHWLAKWDAQSYLVTVAREVPDAVIRHVKLIEGDGRYIACAIDALCEISPVEATELLPRILHWLEDPAVVNEISHAVYRLLLCFAEARLEDSAFTLFAAMTQFSIAVDYDEMFTVELPLLRAVNPTRLVNTLEQQTRLVATQLADARYKPPYPSDWRSAIEETDQDIDNSFEDKLIVALRTELENLAASNTEETEQIIKRYLQDEYSVFVRFALHLLATFPAKYPQIVAEQLINPINLDEWIIHHEFFILLREGYSVLAVQQQKALVELICAGFSPEQKTTKRQWLPQQQGEDAEQELVEWEKRWMRDRLWMIREHLPHDIALRLTTLVSELGEPKHPEFGRRFGPIANDSDATQSSLSEEQISEMSPDELIETLQHWSPSVDTYSFKQDTTQALADTVASVLVANPTRYHEHISKVAAIGSVFVENILSHFAKTKSAPTVPWEFCLDLLEGLLGDLSVLNADKNQEDVNGTSVRKAMVRLLESGIDQSTLLPLELYDRVEVILLSLLSDSDPGDSPSLDRVAHGSPRHISLNHVRPMALSLLIALQVEKAKHGSKNGNQSLNTDRQLPPNIVKALAQRLDPTIDSSLGVRSVFGQHLPSLYWLDKQWTEEHLDTIFPEDENSESICLFFAAFESFLTRNFYHINSELCRRLQFKYVAAIQRLDVLTKRAYLQGLAGHLVADYLLGSYSLADPIGPTNLLGLFFASAPTEARNQAAWMIWRSCPDNPNQFWLKVKQLWLRRLDTARQAGNLLDFQDEFCWYIRLLPAVGTLESFAALWEIIIDSLPCVFSSYQTRGAWDDLEKFLAQQISRDSVRTIKLYAMMREYLTDPYYYQPNETRRKILMIGAENEESRSATLSLIDAIARLGVHGYKDIYDRFKSGEIIEQIP